MKKTLSKPISSSRVFSTRSYPLFGRNVEYDEAKPPKSVEQSPYFWWFKFLQLNKDYKKTCDKAGKGKLSHIYKDLGDVHQVNFKQWWNAKSHLFAEPIDSSYKMAIAQRKEELAPFNNAEVINLVVPLTWSRRGLLKRFTTLVIKKVEKGRRGVSTEKSLAKYRISGKWHIEAMKTAYKIYQAKEAYTGVDRLYWADVAILAELSQAKGIEKFKVGTADMSDVRRTLTILAQRHYDRALQFIDSSASQAFPYSKK